MEMCIHTFAATDPSVVNYHIIHISGGNMIKMHNFTCQLNQINNISTLK